MTLSFKDIETSLTLSQETRGSVNGIHATGEKGKAFDSLGRDVSTAEADLINTRRQLRRSQITRGGDGRKPWTTVRLGDLTLSTSR